MYWELPDRDAPIYVAGHGGLVGSAIWRHLTGLGYTNLIGYRSAEVDLCDRDAAFEAILASKPEVLILAAARVGGIMANSEHPVEFLNENLQIQTNVFQASHAAGVDRLLFLGSSCIYPRLAPQPIAESALLSGPLEPTNDAYAIAKIAGIIGCRAYRTEYGRHWISAMPTNLYGPGDNFDLQSSHVLPAMIRKFHEGRRSGGPVLLWGTGAPRREFMHVDDLARAVEYLLAHYDEPETINVGTGSDITLRELAELIAAVVGYEGEVIWDATKPDGTPRKQLDVTRLRALGWEPRISLADGLVSAYAAFLASHELQSVAS